MNTNHTLRTAARVDATLRLGVVLTFEPWYADASIVPAPRHVTVRFQDGTLLGAILPSQARTFAQRYGWQKITDNRGVPLEVAIIGGPADTERIGLRMADGQIATVRRMTAEDGARLAEVFPDAVPDKEPS